MRISRLACYWATPNRRIDASQYSRPLSKECAANTRCAGKTRGKQIAVDRLLDYDSESVAGVTDPQASLSSSTPHSPALRRHFSFDDKNPVQSVRVPVRIFYALVRETVAGFTGHSA